MVGLYDGSKESVKIEPLHVFSMQIFRRIYIYHGADADI
jgi:hypothetical protein